MTRTRAYAALTLALALAAQFLASVYDGTTYQDDAFFLALLGIGLGVLANGRDKGGEKA